LNGRVARRNPTRRFYRIGGNGDPIPAPRAILARSSESPLPRTPKKGTTSARSRETLVFVRSSSWPGIAVRRTACFRTPMSRPSTSSSRQ